MPPVARAPALLALFSCCFVGGPAAAAENTVRVRGTIERVEGLDLTILTREGPAVTVALAPDAKITALIPADLAAIGAGSFLGASALPQPDGTLRAQEVHVFPEAMRGAGEGHRAWDLTPDSTMTNATVEAEVQGAAGRELTLSYRGGKQELVVPPGTPIVTFAQGDASLLKRSNHVFLIAGEGEKGGLSATRLTVGKDGPVPPM